MCISCGPWWTTCEINLQTVGTLAPTKTRLKNLATSPPSFLASWNPSDVGNLSATSVGDSVKSGGTECQWQLIADVTEGNVHW